LSLLFVNVQEEWFPLVEHEVSEVLVQLAIQYSAVPVVSDTSSLHCLPDELFKWTPRAHFIFVFQTLAQLVIQKFHTDAEVW